MKNWRRYLPIALTVIAPAALVVAFQTPATPDTPADATAAPASAQLAQAPSATSAAATASPTAIPAATDIPAPSATPTPSVEPTPTPRPAGTPLRVGVQAGHWLSSELPDELARLRTSSGAHAGGYAEADVNLDIAQRVAALLTQQGIIADVLPATIPVGYDADAFVSIHADGSTSTGKSGFKIATPWRTSRASQQLLDSTRAEYASASGLAWDDAITFNMRGYYAFNSRRHQHAIARTTPAIIVETGFLTNAGDRALLTRQPDLVAGGIANGILRYLRERDPNDGAALLPPEFRPQRAISPDGIDVRSAPRDSAAVITHADADVRFTPLLERDGWYQVFVRNGGAGTVGWIRTDQVAATDAPAPTPLPALDS